MEHLSGGKFGYLNSIFNTPHKFVTVKYPSFSALYSRKTYAVMGKVASLDLTRAASRVEN